MGVYGGLGPMTNAVLWVEAVVFAIFVGLRLYTRKHVLNSVGLDDYLVLTALVLQVLYTAFVTEATLYGLGQLYADVGDPVTYFTAVKYELFSQVAGLMVIGVGKATVGVFLLRIVRSKAQVWFIWACLAITAFITLFASITVIVQCIPIEKSWNPTTPGYCWLDFSKVGYTVGSWFVAADFAFAILPWFIVWDLNMKQKEKITVACGLSLGVFAGACGIIRTKALSGLNASEYILDDTVPMLIWSATESCVTIMCSSIPVLRPLYIHVRYGADGRSSSSGDTSYRLPLYGSGRGRSTYSKAGLESSINEQSTPHHTGVLKNSAQNASNENILQGAAGIERTDEIAVSYEQFDTIHFLGPNCTYFRTYPTTNHPAFFRSAMSSTPPTSGLSPKTWTRETSREFFISTEPKLLSVKAVNAAYARDFVYWIKKPFPEEVLWQMLHGALSFGVYRWTEPVESVNDSTIPSPENTEQIGLARVVTDGCSFVYLSDTYVLPEYQGSGLGKWLVGCVAETFSKENMPYLRRIMLLTDDERTQAFYTNVFGVKVVGREERKDMGRDLVFMCARPHAQP
ncbi:hypothetical protein PEX2_069810 [Penicillium expansum]|uniref:N-acetyltransferase domain-containing protein n=1 Tax=Penicillium expansum TaxID=27334 RepID=A0A0A2JUF7_PENEN|nr:hypothetical protein PEX2_069810 [Penicillium expansum]KGO58471.1 hypothetical protein PEX2_069810 [Penicillium expansum]